MPPLLLFLLVGGGVSTPTVTVPEETTVWVGRERWECDLLFMVEFPVTFPLRCSARALSKSSLRTSTCGFAGTTSSSARMLVVLGKKTMSGRECGRGRGFERCRAASLSPDTCPGELRARAGRVRGSDCGSAGLADRVGGRTLNRHVDLLYEGVACCEHD